MFDAHGCSPPPLPQLWSDWSGGASTDRQGQQLRLVLARTRALLAHLDKLIHTPTQQQPNGAPACSAAAAAVANLEDLSTCTAAQQLFMSLLQRCVGAEAGSAGDGVGYGLPALELLAQLLSDVWRDGQLWEEQAEGEEAAGKEGGEEQGQQGGAVSPLHGCWQALAGAMLQQGQPVAAIR